jgi:hypothetical protein
MKEVDGRELQLGRGIPAGRYCYTDIIRVCPFLYDDIDCIIFDEEDAMEHDDTGGCIRLSPCISRWPNGGTIIITPKEAHNGET